MASYIWHMFHGYETYMSLSEKTKKQMPEDALRKIIIGVIIPDLATGDQKVFTHYYENHPIYGESYLIPKMDEVEEIFLKRDPTYIGVLSHLKYDKDHIENFLLIYAKPCEGDKYENSITGEKMTKAELFGDNKGIHGQLYQLYDKFNDEMTLKFIPKLNDFFCTNFLADKKGFLEFVKWMFPNNMPLSGIPEMDEYRTTDDINGILKSFFENDGKDCIIRAEFDDLVKIVKFSAFELAKQIDELYSS